MRESSLRHQVPEHDKVYQAERERWMDVETSGLIFAKSSVFLYKNDNESVARAMESVNSMKTSLGEIEEGSEEAMSIAKTIEDTEQRAEKWKKQAERRVRENFVNLSKELILFMHDSDERDRKLVVSELWHMFDAPEIRTELQKHFGEDLSGFTAHGLFLRVLDGSVPTEVLYTAAQRHLERIKEKEAVLEDFTVQTKKEFKEAVERAVDKGFFPETARASLHRVDGVRVRLSDKLNNLRSNTLGSHSGSTGGITVNDVQLTEERMIRLRKTLFHEFLHELSGKSIDIKTEVMDDGYASHRILDRKQGVTLNSGYSLHSKNTWLNEAATEWLALKLSEYDGDKEDFSYKGSSSYTSEREQLDRLFDAGLQEGTVCEAYFENITSEQPKNERARGYAKLVRKINEIGKDRGSRFEFARLENNDVINKIGLQLYNNGAWVGEKTAGDLPDGFIGSDKKLFNITVSVGVNPDSVVIQQFAYLAEPVDIAGKVISAEERFSENIQSVLDISKSIYGRGRVKFDVSSVEK